jgi:hypothetical protein
MTVLRRPVESALAPPIAMVNELIRPHGSAVIERLLKSVEHEAGLG